MSKLVRSLRGGFTLHASAERLAHRLLDRDDSDLGGDALVEFSDACVGLVDLGARFRSLVHVAGRY